MIQSLRALVRLLESCQNHVGLFCTAVIIRAIVFEPYLEKASGVKSLKTELPQNKNPQDSERVKIEEVVMGINPVDYLQLLARSKKDYVCERGKCKSKIVVQHYFFAPYNGFEPSFTPSGLSYPVRRIRSRTHNEKPDS